MATVSCPLDLSLSRTRSFLPPVCGICVPLPPPVAGNVVRQKVEGMQEESRLLDQGWLGGHGSGLHPPGPYAFTNLIRH